MTKYSLQKFYITKNIRGYGLWPNLAAAPRGTFFHLFFKKTTLEVAMCAKSRKQKHVREVFLEVKSEQNLRTWWYNQF